MYTERLQILLTKDQRARLEAEARSRRSSVAGVVREAVEAHLGGPSRDARVAAAERIGLMKGRRVSVADMHDLVSQERDAAHRPPR